VETLNGKLVEDTISGELSEPIIDGSLNNFSMILIGEVLYSGTISVSDWLHIGDYYYYTVPFTTYKLSNASVGEILVESSEGYENSGLYSYTLLPNNDIRFRSSVAVNIKYKIKGEK